MARHGHSQLYTIQSRSSNNLGVSYFLETQAFCNYYDSYTDMKRKDNRYEIGEKSVFESIALEEGDEIREKGQVEP